MMKRQTTLHFNQLLWIPLIMVLPFFSACKKDDHLDEALRCPVEAVNGANDNITGKWKLVKAKAVFRDPRTEDYSCNDIVYDFRADGMLVISGTTKNPIGYDEGQYAYEFSIGKLYQEAEEDYTLKIGNTSLACNIEENQLVINESPLDGPILHLVRVE